MEHGNIFIFFFAKMRKICLFGDVKDKQLVDKDNRIIIIDILSLYNGSWFVFITLTLKTDFNWGQLPFISTIHSYIVICILKSTMFINNEILPKLNKTKQLVSKISKIVKNLTDTVRSRDILVCTSLCAGIRHIARFCTYLVIHWGIRHPIGSDHNLVESSQ